MTLHGKVSTSSFADTGRQVQYTCPAEACLGLLKPPNGLGAVTPTRLLFYSSNPKVHLQVKFICKVDYVAHQYPHNIPVCLLNDWDPCSWTEAAAISDRLGWKLGLDFQVLVTIKERAEMSQWKEIYFSVRVHTYLPRIPGQHTQPFLHVSWPLHWAKPKVSRNIVNLCSPSVQ